MPRAAKQATPDTQEKPYTPEPRIDLGVQFDMIPVRALFPSPLNPRKRMAAEDLVDLAASIKANGVMQALLVRPANSIGEYEIVFGARRHAAARMAEIDVVPCRVATLTDTELLELALQENTHRQDMDPLDEAEGMQHLQQLDRAYLDLNVLGAKIGRTATYVRDRLHMLRLVDVAREAFTAGAITAKHAAIISRLPEDQQPAALAQSFGGTLVVYGQDDTDEEDASVPQLLEARDWARLRPALLGTRDLQEWVSEHARADVAAPEVQAKLIEALPAGDEWREQIAADTPDGEDPAPGYFQTLPQLTVDKYLDKRTASQIGVLVPERDYILVGERKKDRCDHTQRGVISHGQKDVAIVDVCLERRKCETHWPKKQADPKQAKEDAAIQRRREAAAKDVERRKQLAEEWLGLKVRVAPAFVTHVSQAAKVDAALVRRLVHRTDLDRVERDWSVKLTDKTALAVLILDRVTLDYREQFERDAKQWGFNLGKLVARVKTERAAQDKANKAAAAKPAKPAAKKGARKK